MILLTEDVDMWQTLNLSYYSAFFASPSVTQSIESAQNDVQIRHVDAEHSQRRTCSSRVLQLELLQDILFGSNVQISVADRLERERSRQTNQPRKANVLRSH